MWLSRTAAAVDHFHPVSLANQAMTETRRDRSQQVKGRRGHGIDNAWAHRMLLLVPAPRSPGMQPPHEEELVSDDLLNGKLQAGWKVQELLRVLLHQPPGRRRAAKSELKAFVDAAGRPETNKLYRTVCRWWNEIEVLIVTHAPTGKVEANNTGLKQHISIILMRRAVRRAA
ncbi:transposase [Arthrobacter sp. 2YAF22_2]|uniref:transposase n=1 Tax=Arthrobacter sp. 2YAF22_2 TaxID=3233029 RepID=UPI003F91494A